MGGGIRAFCLCAGVVLCSALMSGCLTSSSEDDYVANVLAEAAQEFPLESAPLPVVREPVSPPPPAVSVPVPPVISVPASPAVSVSIPATVSVVKPAPEPAGTSGTATVPKDPVIPVVAGVPVVAPVSKVIAPGVAAVPVDPEPPVGIKPAPSVPTIQPDSVLWVSVSEDPSLNGRYMVNDSSAIDFGYAGLTFLPDMTVEQAEAELKRILEGRYLKNASVSVKLAKASYDRIGVQGSVEMPGDIKIGPGATIGLSEALRRSGGLRGNRQNSQVKIVRGGLKTPFGSAAEGDVYSLVTQDGQLKVPDVFLKNDDLVYVFTPATEAAQGLPQGAGAAAGVGGKRVVLLGEVPRRGVVEFAENEPCTLMYLLFKIGGLPRFAEADKITVIRRNKDGTEKKFLINGEKLMDKGKPEDDFVLETGDRIIVSARRISFF